MPVDPAETHRGAVEPELTALDPDLPQPDRLGDVFPGGFDLQRVQNRLLRIPQAGMFHREDTPPHPIRRLFRQHRAGGIQQADTGAFRDRARDIQQHLRRSPGTQARPDGVVGQMAFRTVEQIHVPEYPG